MLDIILLLFLMLIINVFPIQYPGYYLMGGVEAITICYFQARISRWIASLQF